MLIGANMSHLNDNIDLAKHNFSIHSEDHQSKVEFHRITLKGHPFCGTYIAFGFGDFLWGGDYFNVARAINMRFQ
ncbi:hypothetical protein KY46_08830 [Photobacterium halotolerans]|uniref:Uncharacterized protein n=1 Tax=Photobacterium halotolerans TaxID=265726 RepID=A0A0F5VDT5_9GAMM|nr:hypothetical protein KY46_08830 [Photobacterium halotolerans]